MNKSRLSSNRRNFIASTGLGVASFLASSGARVLSAPSRKNDPIRVAFIGLGGRGHHLMGGFLQRTDCSIVGLCEVNRQRLEQAANTLKSAGHHEFASTHNLQQLLQDRAIDAVVIATPDHWHALAALHALRAGKHAYIEKPVSHNIREGQSLMKASRHFGRVVQCGMQSRSASYAKHAREYIESGKLGKVFLCRVYNQKTSPSLPRVDNSSPPEYLHWDLWNGPNTNENFNLTKFSNWHQFWDYGGGEVANDAIHQLDLACMVLDIESLPRTVHSVGYARPDSAADVPDTIITVFEYGEYPVVLEQTLQGDYMIKSDQAIRDGDLFPYWPQNAERIEIFGTNGVMFLGRHGIGWQVFSRPQQRRPVIAAQEYGRNPDPDHKQDFFDAIREGKRPNADISHGHQSAALCHLANISYRVGNKHLSIDAANESITNCEAARKLLAREYRNPYSLTEFDDLQT